MADDMNSIPSYHTPKEKQLAAVPKLQNRQPYHPSKVMLKIILNRLQPQAEEIIAEEQAGFNAGRSTTEQIFNLRILGEKYLQHQLNLYHVFIDFKKAFDRVWHEALWATLRKYNINASIKICTTRPRVQSCSMTAQENGSELQYRFDKGVYSHQPSLTSSHRESCVRLWMTMKVVSASEDDSLSTSALQMSLS